MRAESPGPPGARQSNDVSPQAAQGELSRMYDLAFVRKVYDTEKRSFDSSYLFWRTFMMWAPIYLTLPLARRGVAPNTVTIISIALGLVGALQFALGHPVLGVLLVLLWQILDCVDGLLASVSDRKSRMGAFLDTSGAHIMYGTLFIGWSVGLAADPDAFMRYLVGRLPGLDVSLVVLFWGSVAAWSVTLRALFSREYWLVSAQPSPPKAHKTRGHARLPGFYRWLSRNLAEFLGFFLPIVLVASLLDFGSAAVLAYAIWWLTAAASSIVLCARRLADAG